MAPYSTGDMRLRGAPNKNANTNANVEYDSAIAAIVPNITYFNKQDCLNVEKDYTERKTLRSIRA
jgi:hypothetical protein